MLKSLGECFELYGLIKTASSCQPVQLVRLLHVSCWYCLTFVSDGAVYTVCSGVQTVVL